MFGQGPQFDETFYHLGWFQVSEAEFAHAGRVDQVEAGQMEQPRGRGGMRTAAPPGVEFADFGQ